MVVATVALTGGFVSWAAQKLVGAGDVQGAAAGLGGRHNRHVQDAGRRWSQVGFPPLEMSSSRWILFYRRRRIYSHRFGLYFRRLETEIKHTRPPTAA